MAGVSLGVLNRNILELRREVAELKEFILEDFEIADDLRKDIGDSRRRPESEFIRHRDVMKRYS